MAHALRRGSLATLLGCCSLFVGCSIVVDFDGQRPKDPFGEGMMGAGTGDMDAGQGCAPGTAGDACSPCDPGQYCEGGAAEAVSCGTDSWDRDQNPETPCVAKTTCQPGEYVTAAGDALSDRTCGPCMAGKFTATENSELCEPWQQCTPGMFIAAGGTTTKDQKCEACEEGFFSDLPNSGKCAADGTCAAGTKALDSGMCAACDAGEYCEGGGAAPVVCAEGTWDHDGSPASPCVLQTDCGEGQYISAASSPTADRVCSACPAGTFSDERNAAECAEHTQCPAGEFVEVPGTAVADRVCKPCADGSYSTTSNAVSCTLFLDCEPGTFVQTAGDAKTDRLCAVCESGHFSDGVNAEACRPWQECAPGSYVAQEGSASADQVCRACPTGTFSSTTNAGMCVEEGECAAGTRQTAPSTSSSPASCEPCAVGQYCAGGTERARDCGARTWDHDANPATRCVPWSNCSAGQFVSGAGSATANRTCSPCADGRFSTASNADECSTWTTCAPGSYIKTAGSRTRDRACEMCPADRFTSGSNLTACTSMTTCGPGSFVSRDPSPMNDRMCTSCEAGEFSAGTNAEECKPWTTCQPPGTFAASPGSPTADRVCRACPEDTESTVPNADQCLSTKVCQAGTRQTAPAMGSEPPTCAPCVAGQYCPGGAALPQACGADTWDHDKDPATVCRAWTNCDPGKEVVPAPEAPAPSALVDRTCRACPAGEFTAATNANSCTPWTECKDGQYVSAEGTAIKDRECESCAVMPTAPGCPLPEPCAEGMYRETPSSPTCTACGPGQYCAGGSAPLVNCGAATESYDDDRDPKTACKAWTSCAGVGVEDEGTATTDRVCKCGGNGANQRPCPDAGVPVSTDAGVAVGTDAG